MFSLKCTKVWEQRKLGDILRTLSFKLYLKAPEQDGKFEIIQQGNDPIIGFANGEPCDDFKNTVIFGDHTLSLFKPKRPFFVATDGVRILQGINGMDGNYLLSLLERNRPKSEGYKRYYSILADREIFFTDNSDEQTQIGSYFRQLDNIITLHQRKLEKLKNIKKSCLEKMFPKNGEVVPEVRFKGFTDDWEQRKLGDICMEMLAGGDIDKEKIVGQGKYPVIANALTNDGIVGFYEHDYRVKSPAVTITGRGDVGHAKARKVDFTPVVRLLAIRTNHDVDFIENAINTLKVTVESTGVPQLTVPQLEKLELFIPPTIAEEQIIGAYLRQLDNLITLHQRKVEKIKTQRKALQQYLLNGIVRVEV